MYGYFSLNVFMMKAIEIILKLYNLPFSTGIKTLNLFNLHLTRKFCSQDFLRMIDSIPKRSLPGTPPVDISLTICLPNRQAQRSLAGQELLAPKAKLPGRLPTGLFRIMFKRFSPADWTSNEIYHAYVKKGKTRSFTYQKLVFYPAPTARNSEYCSEKTFTFRSFSDPGKPELVRETEAKLTLN